MMNQTRNTQEKLAIANCEHVYRWHFLCSDGFTFSAIAMSEKQAIIVLQAERPGISFTFDGCTPCPMIPLAWRLERNVELRKWVRK